MILAAEEGSKIKLRENKVFLPVLASIDRYYFLGKIIKWKIIENALSFVVTNKKTDAILMAVFIFSI